MALVDNQCPECAYGSLDLALTGNGRWKVEWYPVEVGSAAAPLEASIIAAMYGLHLRAGTAYRCLFHLNRTFTPP